MKKHLNLPVIPLRKDSDIMVYYPHLNYFMDKIDNREYFFFTKQLHGIWDAIFATIKWNKNLKMGIAKWNKPIGNL